LIARENQITSVATMDTILVGRASIRRKSSPQVGWDRAQELGEESAAHSANRAVTTVGRCHLTIAGCGLSCYQFRDPSAFR
jgi:hypothetical protein